MRRRWTLLTIAVLAAIAAAVGTSAARPRGRRAPVAPAPAHVTTMTSPAVAVAATNRLALHLLSRLGATGNAVFSPYSIQAALAMVRQGAAGSTATAIDHVLGLRPGAPVGAANAALTARLAADTAAGRTTPTTNRATLLIANGLWIRRGLALRPSFTAALQGDFGATAQPLDFAGAPDAARAQINTWVAGHTGQLIKDLMGPGSIDASTALVLADAIYLKARWASPFVTAETSPGTFTTGATTRVTTPFMSQPAADFDYGHGPGYQAIDLPYRNSRLSLLAVMPSRGTLPQFQRDLTSARLAQIAGGLSDRMVDLEMPKFSLSLKADLVPELSALGMGIAFSPHADFSQITRSTSLTIAAVQHAATLKVDEAGTIAAAATGVALEPTAAPIGGVINLVLDHPFLLFLRDDTTGAVLFAARVENPAAGPGS